MPGALVKNIQPISNPLTVSMPNGEPLQSTHIWELDIPWLPCHAWLSHVMPWMAPASLVFIMALRSTGCKVVYDGDECRVEHNGKVQWIMVHRAAAATAAFHIMYECEYMRVSHVTRQTRCQLQCEKEDSIVRAMSFKFSIRYHCLDRLDYFS